MEDYSNISIAERLRIMEALWDSFRYDNITPPSWHADILEKRKEKIRQGQAEFISIKELKTMTPR